MHYKASHYSYFFEAEDGYVLAYNAFSNSLARVDARQYEIIREILEEPNEFAYDTQDKKNLKKDLIRGSFLVDKDLDEVALLKMKSKMGRYSTASLGLTIAPTLACNFACSYCFEDGRKSETMSEDVQEAVINFVKRRSKVIKSLAVSWFGGEPTLRLDIIETLTGAFKTICEENKINFQPMSIITNGYLLNRENAERLKGMNIRSAQVTIDGPPGIHDSRRKQRDGSGTFSTIIDNIKQSKDVLDIHIRINIDKDNVDHVEEIYGIFEEEGITPKVPFYFGHVRPFTDVCSDISTLCFNNKEHSSIVVELLKMSRKRGVLNVQYPSPHHFGFCIADKMNGYVVAPSGKLFKCWGEIGADENQSVGTIFEDPPTAAQVNRMTRYMNRDPFEDEECAKCNLLPVCAGGCPYIALNMPGDSSCTNFKYNLEEMLRLKYAALNAANKKKK